MPPVKQAEEKKAWAFMAKSQGCTDAWQEPYLREKGRDTSMPWGTLEPFRAGSKEERSKSTVGGKRERWAVILQRTS